MASWQQVLLQFAENVEESFDDLKYRLADRLGDRDPIQVIGYTGYGTAQQVYLRGRVLQNEGIIATSENDTLWDNLVRTYKRFESDEVPGAEVLVRFYGREQLLRADDEGYFEAWLQPGQAPSATQLWHQLELELRAPPSSGGMPVRATASVLVPPRSARFGVISDIDDTVVHTGATSLVTMARTVFLGNARTRLPFKGVAAFYRALQVGSAGQEMNPLFYVSSSPWNLYDLLVEFLSLQNIPAGPLLLRDWGLDKEQLLPTRHHSHKLGAIRQILELYPQLPFLLIGDSGQQDPEIYSEIVSQYSERILAVYIRNVSPSAERIAAVHTLAEQVVAAGSTLILADDTSTAAQHAAQQGWISAAALPEVEVEKQADTAPPSTVEVLLGQQPVEQQQVMVEGRSRAETMHAVQTGAVEAALDSDEQQSPTVVVEGQPKAADAEQS